MQFMINKMIDTVLLVLITSLVIYPFCSASATYPFGKLSSEEFSLGVAVIISLISVFRVSRISIPAIAIGIFGLIITLALQIGFIDLTIPGNNLFTMIEMLMVGIFSIFISSLINNKETQLEDSIIIWLSYGLMLASLFNVLAAFLQYTGKTSLMLGYVITSDSDSSGSGIFGNLGQRNHFIDFISTGLFASVYLFVKGKLKLPLFILFVLAIFFGDVFCAGRGIFVYFTLALVLLPIVFLIKYRKLLAEENHLYKKVILILITLFASLFIFQIIYGYILDHLTTTDNSSLPVVQTGLQRLGDIGQSTYRRFYEWYKAFVVFTQHPILGTGWYSYAHDGIYAMMDPRFMYIPMNSKLYTHCHNSIFNTMAEAGGLGTISLIAYGIFYSLYKLLKSSKLEHIMAFVMLCPLICHSCLEFPLWYAYFLVLFVMLLSFAPTTYSMRNSVLIQVVVVMFAIFCLFFATYVNQANNKFNYLAQVPQDYDSFNANATELKQMVDENGIWKLQALMILDNYIQPGSQMTSASFSPAQQIKYTNDLASSMPYPSAILKQIIYYEISGDDANAVYYANVLAHGFPFYKDQMAEQLSASPGFANPVAAIRAFKYEDRSVLTKFFNH